MTNLGSGDPEIALRALIVGMPGIPAAMESTIAELGMDIEICPTLEDAFVELGRFRPHVVIVDPEQSELGGIGALRAIRFVAPRCGVVLTVDAAAGIVIEAVKAGALECLTKPIDGIRLREVLVRAGERLQMARAEKRRADGDRERYVAAGMRTGLRPSSRVA